VITDGSTRATASVHVDSSSETASQALFWGEGSKASSHHLGVWDCFVFLIALRFLHNTPIGKVALKFSLQLGPFPSPFGFHI